MTQESDEVKEIKLSSRKDSFPLRVKFTDKYNNITDYVLFKTSNEKLILQKPLFKFNSRR